MDFLNRLFLIIDGIVRNWLGTFLPSWAVLLIMDLVIIVILLVIGIVAVLALTWMERKVAARMGDRYGPNRWGPFGVFQAVTDAIKMLIKEDIVPAAADKLVFNLAPAIVAFAAVMTYAVIPFGQGMIGANLSIGILYFAAIGSISTIGLLSAGWASDNKYALLGGFRAAAQLISYEIPMALSIITVVLLSGSLSTQDIIAAQAQRGWFILLLPGVFLSYFLSATAELGRCPFDLMEADSEIIAGHMVEYSGMKFALFFLAEYINLFAGSAIIVTLFLGGWLGPILPSWLWFMIKVIAVIFVMMWIRNTLPRLRIDHLLHLSWKVLVPASLANLVAVSFIDKIAAMIGLSVIPTGIVLLLANVVILAATLVFMGRWQHGRELAVQNAALQ